MGEVLPFDTCEVHSPTNNANRHKERAMASKVPKAISIAPSTIPHYRNNLDWEEPKKRQYHKILKSLLILPFSVMS